MPSASEYSSWARVLDDAARGPADAAAAVRASWETGPLIGGQERPVSLAVDEVQDLVAAMNAELAGLAEECRRRAAVCAAWTAALAAFAADERAGLEDPGPAPTRPAPWAEAGS